MNNHCGEIVPPRSQYSVNIAFLPESTCSFQANLVIGSNADNASHIIPLKGIGSNSILDSPVCELDL